MSASAIFILDMGGIAQLQTDLARSGFASLGEEMLDIARGETPVDTGRLRDGMYAVVYDDGRVVWSEGPAPGDPIMGGQGIELFVGNGVEYARHVHDGTVDTPQHPFLAAALAAVRGRAADIVEAGR